MKIDFLSTKKSDLIRDVLTYLRSTGYCLVENFPIDKTSKQSTSFLKICQSIGEPVSHNSQGTIIWDIKSEPIAKQKGSKVITFSQHNHEADLHTDSQYSKDPEDYFALLTLRPAECGGGQSFMLSLNEIITSLKSSKIGIEYLSILQKSDFPFIVPSVFKMDIKKKDEVNFGPIIKGERQIRYRFDTIQKAFEAMPDFGSKDMKDAFYYLANLINSHPNIKRFYLKEGDCLFINNKTMLHGRTSYTDNNRHLLRIRMNDRSI